MERDSTADAPDDRFAFRSEGYAWLVVFMLFLAGFVSALDRQIINLLVDPIGDDLGITDTQISLLQGFAFALFYSIVAIPLGRLADARRLVGIGEATLGPARISMVSDYFPRRRMTRTLSILNGSVFLGAGIALVVGGLVIDWMMALGSVEMGVLGVIKPRQMTFLVVSVPGLILVGVLWRVVREPPRSADRGLSSFRQPDRSGRRTMVVAVFTDFVLGDPNLIRYSISGVCSVTIWTGAAILFRGLTPYRTHILSVEASQT